MITKNVTLRLGEDIFPTHVPVSQFDTMWQFVFKILYNAQTWTIPSGATAVLNGLKPDGNVFAFAGTIAKNNVTVDADVQMTACAGATVCELSILSDGKTVGTANFVLDVETAPKAPGDVSSETTLPAYAVLLEAAANLTPGGSCSSLAPDDTLTVSGAAADAAAVGARFSQLDAVTPAQLATVLAGKADVSALAAKADVSALAGKADVSAVHNLPSGGTAGQFLVKQSATDYDAAWVSLPAWQGGNY